MSKFKSYVKVSSSEWELTGEFESYKEAVAWVSKESNRMITDADGKIIYEGDIMLSWLYYDNCKFWERMGIKKEDNIVAMALADMILLCKKKFMMYEWETYYKDVYEKCREEIMKPVYNAERGLNGFLANSGL